MTRILLVRPSDKKIFLEQKKASKRLGEKHQPLGLLYLGSSLLKAGFEVRICDEVVEDNFEEALRSFKPDIVGITVTTPLANRAKEITAIAKSQGCRVVVGGPHISSIPEQSLMDIGADIACVGEGESTIVEIAQNKPLQSIKGIVFKDHDKIITNPLRELVSNLDSLPFPSRSLLSIEKYESDQELGFFIPGKNRLFRLFTSRGCPYRCTFCNTFRIFGRKMRFRSPENIVKEIVHLMETYNAHHFMFMDDTFTIDRERLVEFCQLVLKEKLPIKWGCFARVGLTKEELQLMKDSGCRLIGFGVESGSQAILDRIKKGTKINTIIETFDYVEKVGIKTKAFFMVGLPNETESDYQSSIQLACRINPTILWLSMFIPFPGTEIYEEVLQENKDLSDFNSVSYFQTNNPHLLQKHRNFLRKFYLRRKYIRKLIKEIELKEMPYFLKMGIAFLRSSY